MVNQMITLIQATYVNEKKNGRNFQTCHNSFIAMYQCAIPVLSVLPYKKLD